MNIKSEWKKLQKHLTPEQQQDGRRCFYCGVLAILTSGELALDKKLAKSIYDEIRPELIFDAEKEGAK